MSVEKNIEDLYLMEQIYATIFSLTNKLQITGDRYLTGLTSRQFMTIIALLHLPKEEATISNVARKLGTSKQNTNRMISSIEKLGFVTVVPSNKDKRASNILLTEAGQRIINESAEKSTLFMADIFNTMNTSELKVLWSLLQRLYEFDGVKQDNYKEVVPGVSLDEKQIKKIIEHFSQKRAESLK